MFRRLRTGRTRWFVAAAAALALTGGGLYVAIPAHAATSVTDSFEGNPYENWSTRDTPGDSLVWLGDHTQARTGTHAGHFYAPYDVPARAYRPLTVDPPGGPSWCYAEAYLKRAPLLAGQFGVENQPRVRISIKDGGPFGTVLLDGNTYTLANFEYGRAAFGSFAYRNPLMTVDISVTGGMAYVDDLTVRCVKEIR